MKYCFSRLCTSPLGTCRACTSSFTTKKPHLLHQIRTKIISSHSEAHRQKGLLQKLGAAKDKIDLLTFIMKTLLLLLRQDQRLWH